MTRQQTKWISGKDRAIATVGSAIANVVNCSRPEATSEEVRKEAQALVDFHVY